MGISKVDFNLNCNKGFNDLPGLSAFTVESYEFDIRLKDTDVAVEIVELLLADNALTSIFDGTKTQVLSTGLGVIVPNLISQKLINKLATGFKLYRFFQCLERFRIEKLSSVFCLLHYLTWISDIPLMTCFERWLQDSTLFLAFGCYILHGRLMPIALPRRSLKR